MIFLFSLLIPLSPMLAFTLCILDLIADDSREGESVNHVAERQVGADHAEAQHRRRTTRCRNRTPSVLSLYIYGSRFHLFG